MIPISIEKSDKLSLVLAKVYLFCSVIDWFADRMKGKLISNLFFFYSLPEFNIRSPFFLIVSFKYESTRE